MGLVWAKWYGAGMGYGMGHSVYIVQGPHVSQFAAHIIIIWGHLGYLYCLLWAMLGLPLPCPYRPSTGMFTG